MRRQISPWAPAIFCAVLSAITVVADLIGRFATGTAHVGLGTFLCFLPVCFVVVGVMFSRLQQENEELRRKMDRLAERPRLP